MPDYRELIARLPRTFGPAFNDQLGNWDLLFPPEQRQLSGQLEWLSKLPGADLRALFAEVADLESKMELPKWPPGSKGISVEESGLIARSPLYPQWRLAVEKVFAKIDQSVAARPVVPRLIACILPAGLPATQAPLWPQLAKQGTWIDLDAPVTATLVPMLAARRRPLEFEDEESTWILECAGEFEPLAQSVVLDWKSLEPVRREFLNKLNSIKRDLKSVDQTNEELKRTDLAKLLPKPLAARPRVREFIRNLLLSGNGSLVFPSSFVQWGAAEALRRAQPQVMLALFGMRQKLKPFSSAVLFEDQHRNNPTKDEDDPEGSLVDNQILAEYVYLAASRTAAYQTRTLGLFALADARRVLLVGAELPDGLRGTMKASDFTTVLLKWLQPAL